MSHGYPGLQYLLGAQLVTDRGLRSFRTHPSTSCEHVRYARTRESIVRATGGEFEDKSAKRKETRVKRRICETHSR